MNSWAKLPIGEIFSLEKGSLQSTKCTPGGYTFITASSEWKTHNEYSHDCEALIYAVAASGSLGRCHYYNGKFISSDLCFILRAKDEKKRPINYRFYQNVFRFLIDDIVAKTKAGTSKESISQKRFSAYTLPYIDIGHQSYWENKLNNLNDKIENFEVESINQSSYITKLRQAILQEAIEGKLTAGWRKENPVRKGNPDYDAKALLEKVQAEKDKLIKDGKIKKQKPLAPIKLEEVPFDLPEGWIWTRLGEVIDLISGQHIEATQCNSNNRGNPYITGPADFGELNPVVSKWTEFPKVTSIKNDILITVKGSGVGKINLNNIDGLVISRQLMAIRNILCDSAFLHAFVGTMNSALQDAKDGLIPGITRDHIKDHIFALPPLAEQQAIVDRVEKLLSMVDELEKQVSERKEQSEQLMQAVLREAFERGK